MRITHRYPPMKDIRRSRRTQYACRQQPGISDTHLRCCRSLAQSADDADGIAGYDWSVNSCSARMLCGRLKHSQLVSRRC
jgi:hypothetical protein